MKTLKILLIWVVCILFGSAQTYASDTLRIPELQLKLSQRQEMRKIFNILFAQNVKENDVIVIGLVYQNDTTSMLTCIAPMSMLPDVCFGQATYFKNNIFIGCLQLYGHICFVYGEKYNLMFHKTKRLISIPTKYEWLASLAYIQTINDPIVPQIERVAIIDGMEAYLYLDPFCIIRRYRNKSPVK